MKILCSTLSPLNKFDSSIGLFTLMKDSEVLGHFMDVNIVHARKKVDEFASTMNYRVVPTGKIYSVLSNSDKSMLVYPSAKRLIDHLEEVE